MISDRQPYSLPGRLRAYDPDVTVVPVTIRITGGWSNYENTPSRADHYSVKWFLVGKSGKTVLCLYIAGGAAGCGGR